MAFVVKDRVRETTITTGTGTYTLAGAVIGHQAFSSVGDGNTTTYCCTDGTDWEVATGTYTLAGTTLARTAILASSNADAAVSWAAGTKNIFAVHSAASITALINNTQFDTLAELNAILTDATLIDTGDSRLSDARTPTAHAASHTDGSDDIQSATASVKGLATAAQITKLDGIETAADVTDATNVDAAGAVMESDTSTASMSFVVDEDTMSSDSATKVPTQQSTKAYVDARFPASSIDNAVPLYSGTTGKLLKAGSGVYVTGTGMGIGAASPNDILEISKSQNVATRAVIQNVNDGAGAWAGVSLSQGTSVNQELHVGVYNATYAVTGYAGRATLSTDTDCLGLTFAARSASGDIRFFTGGSTVTLNSTEKAIITSTGNVGIGTASPASGFSLHVVDATNGKMKLEGPQPGVVLRETDASNQEWWLTGLGGTFRIRDITAGAVYPFTIEATCPSNTIYATAAGNVGIGTASPAGALDVVGTWQLLGGSSAADATIKTMRIGGNHYTAAEEPVMAMLVYSPSGSNQISFGGGTSLGNAATDLLFYTGATSTTLTGTVRMKITNLGAVGLGATSAASGGGSPCLFAYDAVSNPTGIGTNSAGVFAKDVAGTTEFFAIDEAANATQLTAHASDGPDAAYADPVGGRGVEWILRRESPWKMIDGKRVGRPGETLDGCITWENPRTGVTVSESFAEYVARMGYTTEDAERLGYVPQDWDDDQQKKTAMQAGKITERAEQWATFKSEVARQKRLPWFLKSKPDGQPDGPALTAHTLQKHPFGKAV